MEIPHHMMKIPEWDTDALNRTKVGKYLALKELTYIRKAFKHSSNIKRILEVGCGSGKLTVPIYNNGYDIVAMDYAELPLLWLRKKNTNIRIIQGDAQDLPFLTNSFDCVISIQIIDYLDSRLKFYAEVNRVLIPGGKFLLHFSNKKSIKGLLYGLYTKIMRRKIGENCYNRNY
ncbi:MAG: class I SAM-dependent methyltransferase, partial [Promethearchaeota archaeon]